MVLRYFIRIVNKFRLLSSATTRHLRKLYLKTFYKDRFFYGEQFYFNSTSQIVLDISSSIIQFGDGVQVRSYCFFRAEQNGKVSIGNDVFFNNGCSLNCMGQITIGNNCQFGEGVKLYDHNHAYGNKEKLIAEQGYVVGKIIIGDNCWIGSNVVLLKDVTIGDNSVIGAGCVIHKPVHAGSVVYNQQQLMIKKEKT